MRCYTVLQWVPCLGICSSLIARSHRDRRINEMTACLQGKPDLILLLYPRMTAHEDCYTSEMICYSQGYECPVLWLLSMDSIALPYINHHTNEILHYSRWQRLMNPSLWILVVPSWNSYAIEVLHCFLIATATNSQFMSSSNSVSGPLY